MNAKFAVSTHNSTFSFSIKPSEHVTARPEAVCRGHDDSNIFDNTQRPNIPISNQVLTEAARGRERDREREGRG